MKSSKAMILVVMNAIFSNCIEKPEKFRTSMGFEPVAYPAKVLNFSGFSTQLLKIEFITARIIALLDFMTTVQYMIHFIYHFIC